MNILWLASWYPNKLDKWNGDFVQRHAQAVALYCNITVIHLMQSETVLENEVNKQANLTEIIIYCKAVKSPFQKIVNQFTFFQTYRKSIEKYISENGAPALVHVHVPMKAGIVGVWLKKKYNIPLIVTEHWAIYNEFAFDAYYKRNVWFKNWTKHIIRKADKLLPVSKELGESINRWVMKKDFTVVPNVVDTSIFNYRPSTTNKFRFVHVSTMIWQKQPQTIIDIFVQLHQQHLQTELYMVGPYPEEMYEYAKDSSEVNNSIFFTGAVEYTEVAKQLQQANAFVLFSRYENLPCVILEALCCGLPVISSNVGGINEVIDETNGVLVNKDEPAALLYAMQGVIENYNSYNREQIALAAQQKFSYEVVGKQMYAIYRSEVKTE